MSETTETVKEEQERIKKLINNWEVKQKWKEEELNFVDDWRTKNNLLIFGIV
jgi:hypothetical protein